MASDYEINEKDIDSVLNFLRLTDPAHATPAVAIALLEYMKDAVHSIALEDPDVLQRMYEEMKANKG